MKTESRRASLSGILRLPYAPVIAAPFLLMAPLFLTGRAMFWGTPALQFVPWWWWSSETLRSGHLPLWNPLVGMGAPLLANYQSGLLYPPNWPLLLVSAIGGLPALAWSQAIWVALHLALAGLGMVALVRSLGLDSLPQTVAGLAFGLSGYLVSRAGFFSIVAAAAWLPWIMFGVKRLAVEPRRWILPLGLLWGLQLLAGHAQTAWYTALLSIGWAAYWVPREAGELTERRGLQARRGSEIVPLIRAWLTLAASMIVGAGLAAIQLIPTAEYLLQSQRAASVDFDFAMTYSFWPWRILGLVAPDLFGSPVHGDYWGYGAYWEDALYIGLLPGLLAFGVFLGAWRRTRQTQDEQIVRRTSFARLLAGLILISMVLALGSNTPVFPWLYRWVPTFDKFQAPTRFSIWAVFGLAVLAAVGTERLRKPEGRALYWTRLATAGAVAVALGAGLTWFFLGDVRPTFIRATALAGLLGVGVGILALLAPADQEGQRASWWRWTVAVFVGVDLIYAGWGLNPGVPLAFYSQEGPSAGQVRTSLDGGRLFLGAGEEYDLKFSRFLTFQSFQVDENWFNLRAAQIPNISMLDQLPHTANFDPLVPARYVTWMDTIEQSSGPYKMRLLNLSGVSVVESPDPDTPHGVRFRKVDGLAPVRWLPCAAWAASGDEALAMLQREAFDPGTTLVVETVRGESATAAACDPSAEAAVASLQHSPNHLEVQVSSETHGWVRIPQVWYPGWQAYLDGTRVPFRRADFVFGAVAVPPGAHTVDVRYQPSSFYVGGFISLVSLLAALVYIVRRK